MAAESFQLTIVSPEGLMYSDTVTMLILKGADGELGIAPGHTQLLTSVVPGALRILAAEQENEELFYVSGGILEVQPHEVSILADTVERPQDVNESAAIEAKTAAEQIIKDKKLGSESYKKTHTDLAEALAKLKVLELMRARKRRR